MISTENITPYVPKAKLRVWTKRDRHQLASLWDTKTLEELFTVFRDKPRTSILHEMYDILSGGRQLPTTNGDSSVTKIRNKLIGDGMSVHLVYKSMLWFYK